MIHKTKQLNLRKSSSKLPNMTIILGVKCIDGVVLVGDRKLTDVDKIDFSYGDKITGEVEGFLTAFSGDKSVFDLFRIKLRECTNNGTTYYSFRYYGFNCS